MSVRYQVADHVATVTLARPDVMNAIDLATEAELQRIWSDLEQRRDVRVIVLQGAGDSFCAGFDMSDPDIAPPELWSVNLGGCIEATPAVWKGRIYIGSRAGYLYVLGDADFATPVG